MAQRSLDSIVKKMEAHDMELVVCDSESSDGTPDVVKKFSKRFKVLKILSKRCTRGEGRQIAFENSSGRYIITIDMDVIYNEAWKKFVEWHRKNLPDFSIQTRGSGIYPRKAIRLIGGWKSLNHSEDLDVWIKLARIGSLRFSNLVTGYNFALLDSRHGVIGKIEKLSRGLLWLRDMMALHRISLLRCVYRYKLDPIGIAACLLTKTLSFKVRDVVDVTKYDRNDIIEKNIVELPIDGIRGKWYWKGFQSASSEYKDCLTCGRQIPLCETHCHHCWRVLKEEGLA